VSASARRCGFLVAALLAPAAAPAAEGGAVLRDAVLAADTVWSGTVTVVGRVVVKRGVTLTILPGTAVRFVRVDADGDGIGDGELTVEGRLVARGTRAATISFASAQERPQPKDWTYVMISTSRDSVVEHCSFEHAFTGLQVHLSTALVRNCLFRGNFEALRFSTADVRIERNDIVDNVYGIRYESRGSDAVVARNTIAGNEYGFFPVVKSDSRVRVAGNNIVNRSYNVTMGEEQRADLEFGGNWWGTADAAAIEERLFDGRRDATVGRVLYRPHLEAPAAPCGREP